VSSEAAAAEQQVLAASGSFQNSIGKIRLVVG